MPITPYIPAITPILMPREGYERLLGQVGIRLLWQKSHQCPCLWGGPVPGSPDPRCNTCGGRGVYWDEAIGPFMGLLTWRHMSPTPDEYGSVANEVVGLLQHGEPTLTIPFNADTTGTIWNQASVYDAFTEIDAFDRYTANLQVGGVTAVPYQKGVDIPASGAVTIYNTTTTEVVNVTGYTVSGANVTLPNTYPVDTPYMVEFTANPVFVAWRKAGAFPMVRPFGAGIDQLPRRFRVQSLDLWTRARVSPGDPSPQGM